MGAALLITFRRPGDPRADGRGPADRAGARARADGSRPVPDPRGAGGDAARPRTPATQLDRCAWSGGVRRVVAGWPPPDPPQRCRTTHRRGGRPEAAKQRLRRSQAGPRLSCDLLRRQRELVIEGLQPALQLGLNREHLASVVTRGRPAALVHGVVHQAFGAMSTSIKIFEIEMGERHLAVARRLRRCWLREHGRPLDSGFGLQRQFGDSVDFGYSAASVFNQAWLRCTHLTVGDLLSRYLKPGPSALLERPSYCRRSNGHHDAPNMRTKSGKADVSGLASRNSGAAAR